MAEVQLTLEGAGGIPVAFRRAVESHGLASVAPWSRRGPDLLEVALATSVGPRVVRLACAEPDLPGATVTVDCLPVSGDRPPARELRASAGRLLGLDRDLGPLHSTAAGDPDLCWIAAAGAGAIARGTTVFEDVIRTLLTTNCAWSGTVSMCTRLVEAWGDPVPVAPGDEPRRSFPRPEVLASVGEGELGQEVRLGYRGPSLLSIARSVANGEIELEELGAGQSDIGDDEVERRLRALPGIGPYAAAHVMLLIGRPSRPILDSWTRPRYAGLTGGGRVTDDAIRRRVSPYGPDAGLALWLMLTRDWFEPSRPSGETGP